MDNEVNPSSESSDFQAIQNLRERAAANEWSLKRVMDELEHLAPLEPELVSWCRSIRESLIPQLRAVLLEAPSLRALNAGILLLHLGDEEGNSAITAALRSDERGLIFQALRSLSSLRNADGLSDQSGSSGTSFPLDKHAIFAALQPLLDAEEERILHNAIEVALKYDLPGARGAIGERLPHLPSRIQGRAFYWFGRYGEDRGALDLIETRLFGESEPPDDPRQHYWVIAALKEFVHSASAPNQKRAGALLVRFVQEHANTPGNEMTNLLVEAMRAIVFSRPPLTEEALESVASSTVEDWRRGTALELLGEVRKEGELTRLRQSLTEPKLRKSAARAIAEIARGSADPQLVEALFEALDEEEGATHELVEALLAVDSGTASRLLSYTARLDPHDTMRVRWIIEGLTPGDAIEQLVEAEVIERPSDAFRQELQEEWEQNRDASLIVHRLLEASGRLLWFDSEADRVPPDYVSLLRLFRECGLPIFDISAFWQQVNDATGESTVQFIFAAQVHTFVAKEIGDWYDVESVIQGVNDALTAAGLPHRFVQLPIFDQTILLTFGPEKALRRAAQALHLPLEDDPEVQAFWGRNAY